MWYFFIDTIIAVFLLKDLISKTLIYSINQNCLNIYYLLRFLRYKKDVDHFMKRRLFSRLSIPMFIGTPCSSGPNKDRNVLHAFFLLQTTDKIFFFFFQLNNVVTREDLMICFCCK